MRIQDMCFREMMALIDSPNYKTLTIQEKNDLAIQVFEKKKELHYLVRGRCIDAVKPKISVETLLKKD